jgi:hypothetical protein
VSLARLGDRRWLPDAYRAFTEGLDTADLREAASLLEALS